MTVQETGPLTTESGAPVADSQSSEQSGLGGPAPIQDQFLLETPARPDHKGEYTVHERERTAHARDVGARSVTTSTSGTAHGRRSRIDPIPHQVAYTLYAVYATYSTHAMYVMYVTSVAHEALYQAVRAVPEARCMLTAAGRAPAPDRSAARRGSGDASAAATTTSCAGRAVPA
ncbi:hypothetical protein [Streptomyces sp. NPDC048637]|uniref:hypothetical protein n=1 Tax=Streptomyces sp. NPDC048637 TaxID=3155636 RepID=UPI003414FD09